MMNSLLLVIHEERLLRVQMEKFFEAAHQVLFVNNWGEVFRLLKCTNVSCVVVDPCFEGRKSLKEIAEFRSLFGTIPLILYGKFSDPDFARKCGQLGIEKCIPLGALDDLLQEIPAAIELHSFQPDLTVFGIDPAKCSPRLKKAYRMMMEEFLENITVEEIAHRLGVHRSHLEREWQHECGDITAKQLLLGFKLHYATFLMQNEGLKLKDIARLAGFANAQEFYRSFHSHLGMTASRYRRHFTFADFPVVYWNWRKAGKRTFVCATKAHKMQQNDIDRKRPLIILMMFLHIHCTNVNDPDPPNNESWSAAVNGLQFRIYTDKSSYRQGEEARLNVEFENVSDSSTVILVNGAQIAPAIANIMPLYDLEKLVLSTANGGDSSTRVNFIPLQSNMFNIARDLFKLEPKQKYHEESSLSSDFCIDRAVFEQTREHVKISLVPGIYTLQAIYSWKELPFPTPERQQQLAEMNAPLWKGTLESNKITITVTP